MRILAIRGQNLASLSEAFEIDFTAEPLAGSGIFAITGPTGAGKSTLLDAVCLALFKEIPRLRAAPALGTLGEVTDELNPRDARSILRHGAGEGFAEVDFAMPGGGTYRARWSVKRARSRAEGKIQNYEHTFERLDTAERLGGTRRETLAAIQEVIGLTVEQFGRAVLLAQGDFEAFIRADANERATLLERLTGSQIYTTLGRRAYAKAQDLKAGLDRIRARIVDQNGLDDDQRTAAEAALAEASNAKSEAQRQLEGLKGARQWEQRGVQLAGQVETARHTLAASETAATEAEPRRAVLAHDRRALARAPDWTALSDAETRASQAAIDAETAARSLAEAQNAEEAARSAETEALAACAAAVAEASTVAPALIQARALDIRVSEAAGRQDTARTAQSAGQDRLAAAVQADSEARTAHDTMEQAHAAEAAWLAVHSAQGVLAEREEELARDLASYAVHAAAADTAEAARKGLEQAQQHALTRWSEATVLLDATKQAHHEAATALAVAEQALPPPGVESDLVETRERLTRIGVLLSESERAEAERATVEAALARTRTELAEITARRATQAERQDSLAHDLPAIAAHAEAARREFDLLRMAAEDSAMALRASLTDGDACPVCGATEHHLERFEGKLGEHLRGRETTVKALESRHTELQHEAISVAAALKAGEDVTARLTRDQTEQTGLLDAAAGRSDSARAALIAAAAVLSLPGDPATLPEVLSARRAEADTAHALIAATRNHADSARKAEQQARIALDGAHQNFDAAREALEARSRALEEVARTLTTDRAEAERISVLLDRWLKPVGDWHNYADPVAWLADIALEWRRRHAEERRLAEVLPDLRHALIGTEKDLAGYRDRAGELAEALAQAKQVYSELAAERAILIGGESVAAIEHRLVTVRDRVEEARKQAVHAREQASLTRARADSHHQAAIKAAGEAEADHARRTAAFAKALAEAGLDPAAVERVAKAGEAAIAAEAEALAALDSAVDAARAVLGEREADLATHRNAETPLLTGADLAAALEAAARTCTAAAARRTEADLALRQDDAVRDKTARLRAELDEAAQKAAIWLRLGEAIGDSTGATFRKFAQGLTLDRLLDHANARLTELKPRFTLERALGGDMLIQVLDNDMGGKERGLHNLSGGERFLVSLALALGLAEMSTAGGVKIESLFIDEGFGALDPASLGQAIALLEHLHATGRRVGVISHVEDLKERIPVKIEVTPTGRGTSRVEVVGA